MDDFNLPKAIHPERREAPAPAHGISVSQNPPALLWPVEKGKNVRYSVRLSQNKRFPKRETIATEGFQWAFFNVHRKLASGNWFWQYGVSKNGRKATWSDVFVFEVKKKTHVFETPVAEVMLSTCPDAHPRIWVTAAHLPALRKRASKMKDLALFKRRANRYLDKDLAADDFPPDQGKTEYEKGAYRKWASKALAGDISVSIQWLAPAYLMTGNEKYGREIVRRALHVARWDAEGFTNPGVSDFADGSCMRILAQAYDTCYDLFSEDERVLMREAMRFRAQRFYNKTVNNLEDRVFSAHVWQHVLLEFAEVAFATLGEVPEAEIWATYIYEVWLARVPLLGGEDGGWANGNNYFGTNMETLLSMPELFRRMTGVDLFQHPWYENAIDFMLYTWPPGSVSDGFGDGGEKIGGPPDSRLVFAEALGQVFDNGYAQWYVDTALKDKPMKLPPMLAWYRIRSGGKTPRAKSPQNLPQAKAFRDIGVVSMHIELSDTEKDLMVGFRSCPFGSFNHMHACQNSFNLLFGGERLFESSGYYVAYNDDHFRGWYKHTRGHNSVLIDGKGQTFGAEGYGWIARFLNGKRIRYCLGDASMAYGDAGLTKFRRHVVLLHPQTIVIYDEVEADHEAQWQWLLHSGRKVVADSSLQRLAGRSRTALSQVDILGSVPLHISIDDAFDPPALNWRGKKINGRISDELPKQWHATISPDQPLKVCRFLTVIQVRAVGCSQVFNEVVSEPGVSVIVGDWSIAAELNGEKPASLMIQHRDGKAGLVADKTRLILGKKEYRTGGSATSMLVESGGKEPLVLRSRDQRPSGY